MNKLTEVSVKNGYRATCNHYRKLVYPLFLILLILLPTAPVQAKYSGGTGEPNDPYLIYTPEDLNAIGKDSNDWDKHFLMTADINVANYSYTTAVIAPDINNNNSNFDGTAFTGNFDGNNHTIFSLIIDVNNISNDYLGLFGKISESAFVSNLNMEGLNITGGTYTSYIGGICGENFTGSINNCSVIGSVNAGDGSARIGLLCGHNYYGEITNCYSNGSVAGHHSVGCLCGINSYGTIINCYSTGSVIAVNNNRGSKAHGGLCGYNGNGSIISNCHANGTVTGSSRAWGLGGLCGYNYGTISKCSASVSVTGNGKLTRGLGGLCGYSFTGTITYCTASGFVTSSVDSSYVGGLCGWNRGAIDNCYATGSVNGHSSIGGLCGSNGLDTTRCCYSTGLVTGIDDVGALCGFFYQNQVQNCYYLDTVGPNNGAGNPLTDEQMKLESSFTDWDFDTPIWTIDEGVDYPRLWWETPDEPVADADGPYDINVGDTLTLDASGSTDDDNDIVSYMWDLDDNGSFETDAGDQPVFDVNYTYLVSLGLLVDVTYDIHVKVTDSEQQSDVNDSTLIIVPKPATVVAVDIKPGSCPNPVNVKSSGMLPIAILGTDDYDVTTIDPTSIRLAGVEPIRSSYEDVAAPVSDSNDCNCIADGPDGFLDLTLKFKTQRIVEAVGDVNDGDVLVLTLTGVLFDPMLFETPIEGADCILIRGRHKPINPADINKDGVVNTADFAIFAQNWLQSSIVQD